PCAARAPALCVRSAAAAAPARGKRSNASGWETSARRATLALNLAHRPAVQVAKHFVQRKGMLGAQGKHNGVVRRRGLQFEIERAAKPFPQRQSPRAVHPYAKRRVDDQLHSAGLIEEPL